MNRQMLNSKRYEKSLARMTQSIMPSQLPKIKMDLAGLSAYAKEKGVSLYDLSEQEKEMFAKNNLQFTVD